MTDNMEQKDKDSPTEDDFNNDDDQQSNVSIDYEKFIEEIISSLHTFLAEQEFNRKKCLLKIELLERENDQLKSSQTDKKRQLCYLLRKIEINSIGDNSEFLSEDRTLDEFTSNKLVAFQNMEKLIEENQMLLTFVHEMTMLEKSQYRIDMWNFLNKVADHSEKWRQRAMQLQQASDTLIETLRVENEHLKKESATMNEIVRSAIVYTSTRDTSISEIQLKVQEFKKELLSFKKDYLKDCNQNSHNLRICADQFDIVQREGRKLMEINQELTAEVKLQQENTASQLLTIQSLKKDNEDLMEKLKIQQANKTARYLLQYEQNEITKYNERLTEEVNIRKSKLSSYSEQIQSLKKKHQSTTKDTEKIKEELKIREAKITDCLEEIESLENATHKMSLTELVQIREKRIGNYLEQIKSLEEQYQTTERQNEVLTKQITMMKEKRSEAANYYSNFNPNHKEEKIRQDESPVIAVDTTSKRRNSAQHFDETQNKRRKQIQYRHADSEGDLIIRNRSDVSYGSMFPVSIICSKYLCSAGATVPETSPETNEKSGIATRDVKTSYNLRKTLKKKVMYDV